MNIRARTFLVVTSFGTTVLSVVSLIKIGTTAGLPNPLIDISIFTNPDISPATVKEDQLWLIAPLVIYIGMGVIYTALHRQENISGKSLLLGSSFAAIIANVISGIIGTIAAVAIIPMSFTPEITGLSQELIDKSMNMVLVGGAINGTAGICIGAIPAILLATIGSFISSRFSEKK